MTNNDHLQRQMDFIVNNRAQFSTNIQQLKDLHIQSEKRMTKLEDVCLRLGNALVNLADQTTAAHTSLDTKMAALAESQAHSDQRLSALIDIVMAERNGKGSA
jgi:hypothetical protein